MIAVCRVVGALKVDGALATPCLANDGDRLFQRIHGLARRAPRPTHGGDRIPEPASPQAQLESATAQHVERGRLLSENRWRSEREIRDVGEQPDTFGLREQVRHQHPRVQEAPLVGMILDADEVQPGPIRSRYRRANGVELAGRGNHGKAELDRPSVIHLGLVLSGAELPADGANVARGQAAPRARRA